MSSFEAQPEARDSITLAFEALGRPVVSDEDWHALLKLLKEAKVVASDFDERVMKAVWQRKGGGRKFTHVELRSGVFEEYSRPRPGETEDDGGERRARLAREEEERHKAFKKAHAAEARGKSSGRFDYSANWGHIAESDEDSERDDDMEKASSYIENHRRRGNAKFEAGEYQAAMQQYTAALLKYAEQTWKIEKKTREGRKDYAAVARRSLPDDDEFQRPLIRVATRLFRYQVVLSFCVELIKEVVGEAGHEPVEPRRRATPPSRAGKRAPTPPRAAGQRARGAHQGVEAARPLRRTSRVQLQTAAEADAVTTPRLSTRGGARGARDLREEGRIAAKGANGPVGRLRLEVRPFVSMLTSMSQVAPAVKSQREAALSKNWPAVELSGGAHADAAAPRGARDARRVDAPEPGLDAAVPG